ncbi:biotin-dependent carboxyltransferase family protein [Polaribacter sp.]|uniref:5-oxoprolinase subunit C family protein n=1 Tax=Polaribacter sp. TaxID=1920175 RepID=UPI0025FE445E|nr:biotin-dependent carboxyltransferase family protein [Polaribacter sp.]
MLKVLKAGFFTSIQDKGRVGFASIGVPVSGVMDFFSSDLTNHILNNSLDAAVIEITLGACKFLFLENTEIAISGGNFSPTINDKPISINQRIIVEKHDVLSFGKVKYGVRCYIAVKGGFLSEIKLGSRSFYRNVTKNFLLKKNDIINYNTFDQDLRDSNSLIKISKNHFESEIIECFKGPEFDLLNKEQQNILFEKSFSLSIDNNRMGFKLNEIVENNFEQILTSAVIPGTVQITPSGKLIVLMRDCQVTGGYPRIIQLTENSINILAQKTTNNKFKFKLIP